MNRQLVATGVALEALAWLGRRPAGIRDADGVGRLYDRIAGFYDLLAAPYDWIDGRKLQRQVLDQLPLERGDTVVDLGTGTGRNLPRLAQRVGPTGRVIGVDLSEGMLTRARGRCSGTGHANVDLVQAELRDYEPPAETAAVVAAFALEMVPEHDQVIRRLAERLRPGSVVASVGLREPDGWPEWAIRLGALANRPFGVTPAYRDIRPWTSIRAHLTDVTVATSHAGVVYAAVGAVPAGAAP